MDGPADFVPIEVSGVIWKGFFIAICWALLTQEVTQVA